MFTFTPLLGAQFSSSKASQSILELEGGIKILVDVGWDETFDVLELAELEKHIPTLSLILLTHATISHIGAFAHCCKTFPLFTQIPVYATGPVISLGRTLLQDMYTSAPLAATFLPKVSISEPGASTSAASAAAATVSTEGDGRSSSMLATTGRILLQPPSAEEIARYFSLIHPLKYSQPHSPLCSPFSPPLDGLTLTAYSAGHTVGGTIWHIQHGMESIVYAVDWNQARENVVAGAAWFGGSGTSGTEVIEQLRKPTALICSSKGGDKFAPPGGLQKRDALLFDMIRSSLAKGGSVLIPTDTSARVLELSYALEHAWRDAADSSNGEDVFKKAEIYLAGKKAHSTMRLARSMLEWMDEGIVREFEAVEGGDAAAARGHKRTDSQSRTTGSSRDNKATKLGPFTLKHLKIVEQKRKLEKILGDGIPKVIIASDTSLDWGYSKETFRTLAEDSQNLIILTETLPSRYQTDDPEQPDKMTLGRMIWHWYEERKDGVAMETASSGELLEQIHSGGREITLVDVERAALDPDEQVLYQQYLATQRQIQNTSQARGDANMDNAADALDDGASSTSSEDSDSEQQGRILNFSTSLAHSNRNKIGLRDEDLGVNILLRRKNVFDYDVRGKKGRERMFPYVAPKKRGDEYGEFIRPEEYLRAEEREEVDAQQRDSGPQSEMKLGQKRRWDETGPNGRRLSGGAHKRQAVSPDGVLGGDVGDLGARGELAASSEDLESESENEVNEQPFEGPAKTVYKHSTVTVNARIAFVDYMGLHDKRSLEMLIPLIQPRKLILVGGMKEETTNLADECRNLLAGKDAGDRSAVVDIFTPRNGESVDASVDTNAWVVKLSNNLVRRLKWQHVRSLGVVALTAQLKPPETVQKEDEAIESISKKQKLLETEPDTVLAPVDGANASSLSKPDTYPILDVLPASIAAGTRSMARPLHVGDLRLADLRKLMISAGHKAEFRGEGTLLIDGTVAVRKSSTGTIEVEAPVQSSSSDRRGVSGSFLAVKRKIYEGLAVVGGG
ncbi:cleavage and polyadenylylation specificity factor, putative [Talaromyces stipitatus ATCC 10500]|uniref:Cleavage and polyadenylation specificity factor subunit 2 n=1 Tax=Talaromyces stipitatus (strain ATCC 10500 / CBS 375.48 / QM 6759 / NRRL 1006) TaxID=441959 RepID=B8M763_TALSN|nr:cleavage and polyadenylylation specificity factor, putative [Talaromyces stipitatus ATCC 10500]EED20283.1 cleavage and polyadenylylation specificity factor, putative [Talaromyces stipitatus ATCC 10500]